MQHDKLRWQKVKTLFAGALLYYFCQYGIFHGKTFFPSFGKNLPTLVGNDESTHE